jgi:hypothetical protein
MAEGFGPRHTSRVSRWPGRHRSAPSGARCTEASDLRDAGFGHFENRHGLAVDGCVTQATGFAERGTTLAMAANLPPGATLGADRGYDMAGSSTPSASSASRPMSRNTPRTSGVRSTAARRGMRGTRSASASGSSSRRSSAGPDQTVALFRKTRHRGVRRVGWLFTFALAVYNLGRIRSLTWARATA